MTKKAYIIPETLEMKIQTAQILAGSPELPVNPSEGDGVNDEDDLLAPRQHYNVWDD